MDARRDYPILAGKGVRETSEYQGATQSVPQAHSIALARRPRIFSMILSPRVLAGDSCESRKNATTFANLIFNQHLCNACAEQFLAKLIPLSLRHLLRRASAASRSGKTRARITVKQRILLTTARWARGKYIVEGVAVCGQCHTQRDSSGAADHSRWLEGAPVWLESAESAEDWPLQAPRIAGTLPWNRRGNGEVVDDRHLARR